MFEYENKYKNLIVAGVDEAGRGPLAGPVVCACVVMPLDEENLIEGINDSKKLSAKKREELYQKIIEKAISYSIVEIDEKCIDDINILNATKKGMALAVEKLSVKPNVVLIDAVKLDIDLPQENIIKGVYRDRKMIELDKSYPQYQFAKHKGYGTKDHIEALKKFGKCPLHRESFIKNFKEIV